VELTDQASSFCLSLVVLLGVCTLGIAMACHITSREPRLPTGQFSVHREMNNPFVICNLQMDGQERDRMSEELVCLVFAGATLLIKGLQLFVNKYSLNLRMSQSIVPSTGSL